MLLVLVMLELSDIEFSDKESVGQLWAEIIEGAASLTLF